MNYSRQFTLISTILATAALAAAQWEAPPRPATAPTPQAAPTPPAPQTAPIPATPAAAPSPMRQLLGPPQDGGGIQFDYMDRDQVREVEQQAREMEQQQRVLAQQQREMEQQVREQASEMLQQARQQERQLGYFNFDFAPFQATAPPVSPRGLSVNVPAQFSGRSRNDGTLYGRGLSALDEHHYSEALNAFTEVVNRGGPKADGALYWKAYTLNKLGRRDEATAAIAQLRTSYASSHWMEDAKALELEVKQASGKPVSPENESDDDLKLMALNGLSQSDPERTYPLIEKILKGPASPKLKQKAIYVLAANSSPRAQQLLEQIARGNSNPDLQVTAIRYMVENKQQPNRSQVLMEIYSSTSDQSVKREILNAFRNSHDTDHLMQIYKSEKDSGLRSDTLGALGDRSGNAELWQLFQADATPEGRIQIIHAMYSNGNTEKLAEVARTDKDPKVRMAAISMLASYRAPNLSDTMSALYSSEQDPQVKRAIINSLSSQRNPKALVDIFHKESNVDLKKDILSRLQNMHTPEANELFLEILK